MDFGITFPSYIRAYHDAKLAEDYGFSHAWFYDSQMCYSDVYAAMALAAGRLLHKLSSKVPPTAAIGSHSEPDPYLCMRQGACPGLSEIAHRRLRTQQKAERKQRTLIVLDVVVEEETEHDESAHAGCDESSGPPPERARPSVTHHSLHFRR